MDDISLTSGSESVLDYNLTESTNNGIITVHTDEKNSIGSNGCNNNETASVGPADVEAIRGEYAHELLDIHKGIEANYEDEYQTKIEERLVKAYQRIRGKERRRFIEPLITTC